MIIFLINISKESPQTLLGFFVFCDYFLQDLNISEYVTPCFILSVIKTVASFVTFAAFVAKFLGCA